MNIKFLKKGYFHGIFSGDITVPYSLSFKKISENTYSDYLSA